MEQWNLVHEHQNMMKNAVGTDSTYGYMKNLMREGYFHYEIDEFENDINSIMAFIKN